MAARGFSRMETLSCILSDGLTYSWFDVEELDVDAVTAVVVTEHDDQGPSRHEIGPDDVARGLRMYREYLEGKREAFPGEWGYAAQHALQLGRIQALDQFDSAVHARADADSYGWQTVKFDRTNGADGDYDANTADSVLQFAVFGHLVYG